eukprot:1159638-Pelagomonas_calceolata.AAC.4
MLVSQRTALQAGNTDLLLKGAHCRHGTRTQRAVRCRASAGGEEAPQQQQQETFKPSSTRRAILLAVPPLVSSAVLQNSEEALAIQGGIAGRIPGVWQDSNFCGYSSCGTVWHLLNRYTSGIIRLSRGEAIEKWTGTSVLVESQLKCGPTCVRRAIKGT